MAEALPYDLLIWDWDGRKRALCEHASLRACATGQGWPGRKERQDG